MSRLLTLRDVEDAARTIRGIALRTPLVALSTDDGEEGLPVGAEIRVKCENLQPVGSFKLRGAYTMVSRLDEAQRSRGLITYSSGNHAQAVAFVARSFGVPAVVVMPTTASTLKADAARRLGAEVLLEGTTSIERRERAEAVAADRGLTIVPPFDHRDLIAGQGTVGLEILDDWPDVDAVLVPIGGGGLVAGVAAAVKQRRPGCLVIGVEPVGADAMRQSVAAGAPVTLPPPTTIADGLAPVRPGDLNFELAQAFVDEIVTVPDDAIQRAAVLLLRRARVLAEFSGAATLAALLAGSWLPNGRRTALILSGGNIEPRRLLDVSAPA